MVRSTEITAMKLLLELGNFYISDFVSKDFDYTNEEKYSLDLYLDEEVGAPRLQQMPPADKMYGKYWYRSGINASMVAQLKDIVAEVCSRIPFKSGIWLDIACNDGTMFKFIPNHFTKVGIDPADNTFTNESRKLASIVQDFFSEDSYNRAVHTGELAKIITSIAMFYDLDEPHKFIADIKKVMDPQGVWILQLSYTPLMIEQLAFDNICHEHVYYHSLTSIKNLVEKHDMEIVDATLNDTNGGSVRIYVRNKDADVDMFCTQPLRDVCNYRVKSLLNYEASHYDVYNLKLWKDYGNRIESLKEQTVKFIEQEVNKGKVVMAYGASTKGNTLLQHFGLDGRLISAASERSPAKFGLYTIGTNIPIISDEDMRKANPDYLLVLPWHFISNFIEREQNYLAGGGKFIVPCPQFKVIGANNA